MTKTLCLKVVAVGFVAALSVSRAQAGPAEDLENRKREYTTLKDNLGRLSDRVNSFFDSSRKLRELDRTEMDDLIERICASDLEPSEEEERRLVEGLRDNVVLRVSSSYNDAHQAGEREHNALVAVRSEIDALVKNIDSLTSIEEVKSSAASLLGDAKSLQETANRLQTKLDEDYNSLTNVSNGAMKGANNPRIRAAMEYGIAKHEQLTCPDPFEKEFKLRSGALRADCVSFRKDDCTVWEFKSDKNFSDSSAAAWANEKYVKALSEELKEDARAKDCKFDANGFPVFEARGKVYTACRPSSFSQ